MWAATSGARPATSPTPTADGRNRLLPPDRAQYVGPGHWNDPDMLVVGKLGWGRSPSDPPHPERADHPHQPLVPARAPLIIGCDLTQLDSFTKALLHNHEVIDVDQDPLGNAATRRSQDHQPRCPGAAPVRRHDSRRPFQSRLLGKPALPRHGKISACHHPSRSGICGFRRA